MGDAQVDIRYQTVHKVYPHGHPGWKREVAAYEALPWAAPRLMYHGEGWLETERCTPIIDLGYENTVKYQKPLRELLKKVNDAGWWHCDIALENVVVHPVRGVLLIDWENARPAESEISYDLYGADIAGVEVSYEPHRPKGVWWGGPWPHCPGPYWGGGVYQVRVDRTP